MRHTAFEDGRLALRGGEPKDGRGISNRRALWRAGAAATALLSLLAIAATWLAADAQPAGAQGAGGLSVAVNEPAPALAQPAASESCVKVSAGDEFPIDIYVHDADRLKAWELRFAIDHTVIEILDHDYNQFLASTPPYRSLYTLFDEENPDRYFLAAGDPQGGPDSGTGVLARLTVRALKAGTSPASIVTQPVPYSPILTTVSGSTMFEGPVQNRVIAVDSDCPAPPTGQPLPGGPTPGPGAGPQPQPIPGGATPAPPAVANPPGGPGNGGGDADPPPAGSSDSGDTAGRPGDASVPDGQEPTGDDDADVSGAIEPPERDGAAPPEEGVASGSSGPGLLIVLAAIAGAALVTGGGLSAWRLRQRT